MSEIAVPVRRLFSVTSWMIALVAAGMAGQAAATLAGIDLIPSWGYQVWDTSWLLPEESVPGRALHALVGYSDRPMGVQIVAYLVVLAVLSVGGRLLTGRSPQPTRSPSRTAEKPDLRHRLRSQAR